MVFSIQHVSCFSTEILDPPSKACSSFQALKKKAKLCLTMSFIGSGLQKSRRCWQTLLQIHMVALWLPLLFKGEGRHALILIQTGFAARLWSSKLSSLQRGRETFNKSWLVPFAASPTSVSSVSEHCISASFHLSEHNLHLAQSPSPPAPLLSLHQACSIQRPFRKEDFFCTVYANPHCPYTKR